MENIILENYDSTNTQKKNQKKKTVKETLQIT